MSHSPEDFLKEGLPHQGLSVPQTDGLSNLPLKCAARQLSTVFIDLFQPFISTGVLLNSWCTIRITPLPKKSSADASIKLICHVIRGPGFSYLINYVCERHIKASSDFVVQILGENQHPLYEELSKVRSHTSIRSRFHLLPSKAFLPVL